MNNQILESLNWRYAVKSFNTNKVSQDDLVTLKESIKLSPSSYGLQPFRVEIVEDKDELLKLQSHSYNQKQIGTASHLFVFIINKDVNTRIDQYETMLANNGMGAEGAQNMANFMKSAIGNMSEQDSRYWASNQSYLALGVLMSTLSLLKIDSCAMEGFSKDEYNKYFELDTNKEEVSVIIPIGYREDEPRFSKLRFDIFAK